MSKERARRRAQRQALAEAERTRRARRNARRRMLRRLRPPAPARGRRGSARDSRLAVQRRRQDGALLAILLGLHVVLWLATDSWWLRLSALLLTVLTWPVLVTLLFDRRPRL